MPTGVELLIGAVGIVTGGVSGWRAMSQFRLRRQLKANAATDLTAGEIATVSGPTRDCGEEVTAPLTGRSGVVAGLQVERRSGSRPGWQTTELHARGVPFELRSNGQAIEVATAGIEFGDLQASDAATTTEQLTAEEIPQHLWDDVERPAAGNSRRYTEIHFSTDQLTAVGPVAQVDDGETCTGVNYQIDVAGSTIAVLSDYTPESLHEQYSGTAMLKPTVVAAAAFLLAAFVLL